MPTIRAFMFDATSRARTRGPPSGSAPRHVKVDAATVNQLHSAQQHRSSAAHAHRRAVQAALQPSPEPSSPRRHPPRSCRLSSQASAWPAGRAFTYPRSHATLSTPLRRTPRALHRANAHASRPMPHGLRLTAGLARAPSSREADAQSRRLICALSCRRRGSPSTSRPSSAPQPPSQAA